MPGRQAFEPAHGIEVAGTDRTALQPVDRLQVSLDGRAPLVAGEASQDRAAVLQLALHEAGGQQQLQAFIPLRVSLRLQQPLVGQAAAVQGSSSPPQPAIASFTRYLAQWPRDRVASRLRSTCPG